MSIEKFIKRVCVQTAVYWGNPKANGYGGWTYNEGIEIKCRWNITTQIITGSNGEQIVSNAEVLVTQDLEPQGYIWLGTLAGLNAIGMNKLIYDFIPTEIAAAEKIKRFDKTPEFRSTTKFVRKAYL